MENGTIIKGIGGFYYVDVGENIVECKARGHFRKDKLVPCVGDRVTLSSGKDGKGSIDSIHQRRNIFVRPPVANIDALVIVVSLKNPEPDLVFLDKSLIIPRRCFGENRFVLGTVNEHKYKVLLRLFHEVGLGEIVLLQHLAPVTPIAAAEHGQHHLSGLGRLGTRGLEIVREASRRGLSDRSRMRAKR